MTPRKFSSTGSAPSEIFVLQHPSEIFNLAPPQKFRISDPFGKSRQQGGVDIKWNGPIVTNDYEEDETGEDGLEARFTKTVAVSSW